MEVQKAMDLVNLGYREFKTSASEALTQKILLAILEELQGIRAASEQANEPDPDAEPDPFQTLNGPVTRVSIDGGVSWPPE